jgi:hypothetical protein
MRTGLKVSDVWECQSYFAFWAWLFPLCPLPFATISSLATETARSSAQSNQEHRGRGNERQSAHPVDNAFQSASNPPQ